MREGEGDWSEWMMKRRGIRSRKGRDEKKRLRKENKRPKGREG